MTTIDDGPLHGRLSDGARETIVRTDGPHPYYATEHAAGADLRAAEYVAIEPGQRETIRTGLRIALPVGTEAQVRPRSGLSRKGIDAAFGTIDADYRGEIAVILINNSGAPFIVQAGDRIAQLVIAPVIRATFRAGDLDDTPRGAGGFGSTGTR